MYNFCVKINLKNDSNSILFRSLYCGSKNTKRTLTLEPQMIVIYTYLYIFKQSYYIYKYVYILD